MVLGFTAPASAADSSTAGINVDATAKYLLSAVKNPAVSSVGGDWVVVGLARGGCAVPKSFYETYYGNVSENMAKLKGTDCSRVILGLTAAGEQSPNISGADITYPLGDFGATMKQGINGAIFALLALDCGDYPTPANKEAVTQATRELYVNEILKRQLSDGGWNLTASGSADPDVTAMTLQALAKYQQKSAVKAATDKALACLSKLQSTDGGYASWGTANSESAAQVLIAMCELGVSITDSRFVKNEKTVLDGLLAFRNADGSFSHTLNGGANQQATEQAFLALVSARRIADGEPSLYRMSGAGLPGKNPDVHVTSLAAAGSPNATITRAEFAAMVTKDLGLPEKTGSPFTDVPVSSYYTSVVATAYYYGIVSGVSATVFNPNGAVTRQEAAVMVTRAANVCGVDTARTDAEITNILARFKGGGTAAVWAKSALAFCYDTGIISGAAIVPAENVTRGEVADMMMKMLRAANLI